MCINFKYSILISVYVTLNAFLISSSVSGSSIFFDIIAINSSNSIVPFPAKGDFIKWFLPKAAVWVAFSSNQELGWEARMRSKVGAPAKTRS